MSRLSKSHLGALSLVVALGPVLAAPGRPLAEKAPALPAPFRPPREMVELFRARAEGTQIYECKAGKAAGELAWALKGPRAELFDDHGTKIGAHYAGPWWEATDGSKVTARVRATRTAPDANAVPWLLLKVTERGGKGRFDKVKYIQRVDTWAGRAPAGGCDRAGKEVQVKYQATYVFYGER